MALETRNSDVVRFATFQVDLRSGELRKQGLKIKLQEQPFRVLKVLLQRPGELVTREELRNQNWPPDTFVDFENSLNPAINKLRDALGDSPDNPRFIETLPRRGYRFIAPVIGDQQEKSPVPAEESKVGDEQPGKNPRISRWLIPAAVVVLALLALAYIITIRRGANDAAHSKINSLAVLPLKNLSGDPTQEYLADGMTEALIGCLSMIRGLRVISRTSVMSLKDTKLTVPDIAKTLQVDALVEGSVIREGSRIRVNAQLIRGATDEHFWSEAYDRELPDVLALESDVAQSIARKVEVTVTGEEHSRIVATRQVAPEVYESYLKGQFKGYSRAEIEQSIAYFEEAIRKDPSFAPAYVGLAEAYERLAGSFIGVPTFETRPKAIRAAHKALELDPSLAEAHTLLGTVLKKQFQWADAEAEYKQALALNPNNSAAHVEYADWLASHGRMDEALAWARRARELDPLGSASTSIGWLLFH